MNIDDLLMTKALQLQKPLSSLDKEDFLQDSELMHYAGHCQEFIAAAIQRLQEKIHRGNQLVEGKKILHTAPHHDDILLGYYGYMQRNLAKNQNYVVYLTSGARGISDDYLAELMNAGQLSNDVCHAQPTYEHLLQKFVVAYRQGNLVGLSQIRLQIFQALPALQAQQLKGLLRQSESDCKWMLLQGSIDHVLHADMDWYYDLTDDNFNQSVRRFVEHLEQVQPDIITVAIDPCGVGPSTHFVSLQLIAAAVSCYVRRHPQAAQQLEIIGYRNIWSNFSIASASMIVPVSHQELHDMESIFQFCFASQAVVKHPVMEDMSFAQVARMIQEQQGQDIALLLKDSQESFGGKQIADQAGCILLQTLTVEELLDKAVIAHRM